MHIISFISFLCFFSTFPVNGLDVLKLIQDGQLETDYYSEIIQKTKGEPWPLPKMLYNKKKTVLIDAENFFFETKFHTCDILENALKRYYSYIFKHKETALRFESRMKPTERLSKLEVVLFNPCTTYPDLNLNESCKVQSSNQLLFINLQQIKHI